MWDKRQLIKVAAQQFDRHTSPRFLRLHVLRWFQVVAQTSPIGFAQGVSMKQRS